MRQLGVLIAALLCPVVATAAAKPHVISFGQWTTVQWFVGSDESKALDLKVRPLHVDGRLREFTLGMLHEVTDRLFVVRRAFRMNDALPEEAGSAPRWRWQRGGWLLVDRVSGQVSPVILPEFDAYRSVASWYRDYAAYCGVSDDGKKLYTIVAQLGHRKPLVKKLVAEASPDDAPDSACPAPQWQREPARVTFTLGDGQKTTYEVHRQAADILIEEAEEAPR